MNVQNYAAYLPESDFAARTKPSSGWGWGLLWAFVGVPFAVAIAYLASPAFGSLLALIGWVSVAVWLWWKHRAVSAWQRRNGFDYWASQDLEEHLGAVTEGHEPLSDASPGVVVVRNARVGEVNQHFDQRLSAAVTGWLHHELGLHGWGVGGSLGSFGLGTGKLGISGSSIVELDVSGVLRDDLSGDGFVAVLERHVQGGAIDTVRVIAPSEPACREYVANLVRAIGASFGSGSHRDDVCQSLGPELAASFPCNVTHVSDQLRAILRQPPGRRPVVSIVGEDLGGSVVLGGAIRIGPDGPWQQLFPIGRSSAILSAVGELTVSELSAPAP